MVDRLEETEAYITLKQYENATAHMSKAMHGLIDDNECLRAEIKQLRAEIKQLREDNRELDEHLGDAQKTIDSMAKDAERLRKVAMKAANGIPDEWIGHRLRAEVENKLCPECGFIVDEPGALCRGCVENERLSDG